MLIDPPYEDKMDYRKVKDALAEALGRFPTGTYAVWYPLLQRMESRQFADKLKQLPAASWLNVTLTTNTPMPPTALACTAAACSSSIHPTRWSRC